MKSNFFKLLVFCITTVIGPLCQANVFKIKNLVFTGAASLAEPEIRAAIADIENQINNELPDAENRQGYLNGMNNSFNLATAASSGIYGQNFDLFLAGFNLSVGADLGSENLGSVLSRKARAENLRGFGAQSSVTAGINLGSAFKLSKLEKLRVYLNFMSLGIDFDEYQFNSSLIGLYAQYKILEKKSFSLINWTGLDVGAGLQRSSMNFEYKKNVNESFSETAGPGIVHGNYTGNAQITANTTTFSLPTDVSSGIRFFYFLKLVGGFGLDLNLGKLSGKGVLGNSSFNANYSAGGTVSGNAILDVNGKSNSSLLSFRGFLGLHIEYKIGALFLQLQKSFNNRALAANAGFNFFW